MITDYICFANLLCKMFSPEVCALFMFIELITRTFLVIKNPFLTKMFKMKLSQDYKYKL